MKIEIKNFKYSDFASEETHCFEATVYVNGKRKFQASNDGHGGCNSYYPLNGKDNWKEVDALVVSINGWLKDQGPVKSSISQDPAFLLYKDLDWVISDLVTAKLYEKDAKRITKKIAFFDGENIRVYAAKFKPTEDNLNQVRDILRERGHVLLNDLPIEDVVGYLKRAA